MSNESQHEHISSFVAFRAGSTVGDVATFEAGSVNVTAQPERTTQVLSPSSSTPSSNGSVWTDDELCIAVGGGIVIFAMLCIMFVSHKRRWRKTKGISSQPSPRILEAFMRNSHVENPQELYRLETSSFSSSAISFGSRASCFQANQEEESESWNHPKVLAVRVSVSEIFLDELVARGINSEVYRGQYRNQTVAIKKPLPQWLGDRDNLIDFFARVKVLSSPSLTHPSMVSFLGVSWKSLIYVCIVSEFMAGGDLRTFLNRRQYQNDLPRGGLSRRGFCRQKVKLASQVASALSFLHAQGLVHSAVRSRNILLDSKLNAKLTGFIGSSIQPAIDRRRPSLDSSTILVPPASTSIGVTEKLRRERSRLDALWSAPEVLRGERSNAKTDMFSFGVVLAELDSLTLPYGCSSQVGVHSDSTELLEKVAAKHVRVHFSSSARVRHGQRGSSLPAEMDFRITEVVVRLGKACVALNASERPSAAQVSIELHKLLQTLNPSLPVH
ncbi:hypothetical protein DD238_003001 [Peronospora effusa]|uniref:Protein kinase domain-containing protein n=1 Tax=Peronospora effusa TaxID=542832 RepID=A0A3M6VJ97_9STRA|nr:hypothetical protein DD238_003001 [Peronospora effusa]RQM15195.1 hypothetical protein DD237_002697 [Peronospora effusa]